MSIQGTEIRCVCYAIGTKIRTSECIYSGSCLVHIVHMWNYRKCFICECMFQKGWDFSQRRDPSNSWRTTRVEDGRNGKTWQSKSCEPKFGIKTNKYWLSDKQLHHDLHLQSGFSMGVAKKRELCCTLLKCAARGGAVAWGTALQAGMSQVSMEFFIDISFRPHCVPGIDSACNRNEYQEYFLGVKVAIA
jgi:hypothetical protein